MRIRIFTLPVTAILIASLTGCLEEKAPEPTTENCSKEMYKKIMADLSKESSKNEFSIGCKALLKAHEMTKWEFKKSPEDQY